MLAQHLVDLRKGLDLTQTEMATAIGMGLRNYQNLESGETSIKKTVELAILYASLERSIELSNPTLAEKQARRTALNFCRMIAG